MGVIAPKKECAVAVCSRQTTGWQDYCKSHYTYWKMTGKVPTHQLRLFGVPPLDRFMSKVSKVDGCWLWTARINASGYGVFGFATRSTFLAHRWAYEQLVGPIPEGLQLDHLCRVRACVNPDHLEPVTNAENVRRSPIHHGAKTHCKRNHEFTPENTYWNGAGRVCRACSRLRSRQYQARKAALS